MTFQMKSKRLIPLLVVLSQAAIELHGAAVPSPDINTYVLFAYYELSFKGGDGTTTGIIDGGNVGVNFPDPNPGDSSALINVGTNRSFIMSDGTQLVADSLRFGSDASAWDVFANNQVGACGGTIRNAGPLAFSTPVIAPLDLPLLDFVVGSNVSALDITVNSGSPLALTAGVYGQVIVQNGEELNLGAGVYFFDDFLMGQNTTITTVDDTIIYVDGKISIGDGSTFGSAGQLATIQAGGEGVTGATESAVNFGQNVTVFGNFFSPNKRLSLGKATDLYGIFWAYNINSDFNVNVTFVALPNELSDAPEPGVWTTMLIGLALLGLGGIGRKKTTG